MIAGSGDGSTPARTSGLPMRVRAWSSYHARDVPPQSVPFGDESLVISVDPDGRPAAPSREHSERVTERAAAKMCGVSMGMVRLWAETGAWPMPRRSGAAPATFGLSDVEGWLATGAWPTGARFRA